MLPSRISPVGAALLAASPLVAAQQTPFSIDSDVVIKQSAATLAWDMMQYYHGNESGQTPGILPGPPPPDNPKAGYYWWEAGAMWGTLMDYWHWTGDDSYNNVVIQAMQFQTGEHNDYQPNNVSISLGNDDQAFWGMSAMRAAEVNFPNPPSGRPGWLALAQAVWNTQADPLRHDEKCGGGLRWQIPLTNNGYDYKNSIANGCFFNMGARLARYTDDQKYADWAEKTWDWMESVKFLNTSTGAIYDGAGVDKNCTLINRAEYSYNNGVFAEGAAFMYNYTNGSEKWKARVELLVDYGLKTFFPKGIAVEVSCENNGPGGEQGTVGSCTNDMICFKGFVHRWYSGMTLIAPFLADKINPVLESSTAAAIKVCNDGPLGRTCGFKWALGRYDGNIGAGQEMSALAAVSSLLAKKSIGPYTAKTGGTSQGDPDAGKNGNDFMNPKRASIGDKAGASIVTIIILGCTCGMFFWMSTGA